MSYQLEFPKQIEASIPLPSSKSISNRALIIYALTPGGICPSNLAQCDDTDVLISALNTKQEEINIGAAGTSMRFLTAYLAVSSGDRILTGTERMKNRPIHVLVEALRSLGAEIEYLEKPGFPPLRIRGKQLIKNRAELDGSVSSQFISALLLIAPTLHNGLQLRLTGSIASKPYIDMTLKLMTYYGAKAYWKDTQTIFVAPQPYKPKALCIEADWSAASYWFSIAALAPKSTILLQKLTLPSLQGDAHGAELFKKLGVNYQVLAKGVQLQPTHSVTQRLELDFSDIPDLVQTFAVTACLLNIPFYFRGISTLFIKETNRVVALQKELAKLGYELEVDGTQALYWTGKTCTPTQTPCIETYEDHRMAMAFAPAAILYPNLRIQDPEVVTKSYPDFWIHIQECGVQLLKK